MSVYFESFSISGDFTFNVWLRNVVGPVILFNANIGASVAQNPETGAQRLGFNDGVLHYNDLTSDFSLWTMLTISRDGSILRLYENGALLNTFILDSIVPIIGNLTVLDGTCYASDILMVERAVSDDGILYRYSDMTENRGNATCPVM